MTELKGSTAIPRNAPINIMNGATLNSNLSAEEGTNAFKEFEIKRAYLGYSHQIADDFSAKVTFDVGKNEGGSS